ncbi:MAG: hypothetical protein ACYTEL_17150 [Planctomycetota bacterium]|jgi:hypothetical protein
MKASTSKDIDNKPRGSGRPLAENDLAYPKYEFYEAGVHEPRTGWLSVVCGFLKGRADAAIIAGIAVVALWQIAEKLIEKGSGLDKLTLIGCLTIAAMIFVIGMAALFKATKQYNAQTTQECERQATQSGVEARGAQQDGAAPG